MAAERGLAQAALAKLANDLGPVRDPIGTQRHERGLPEDESITSIIGNRPPAQKMRFAGRLRFKSPVGQDDGHLWAVLRYIEANPLRAEMVADPADYPWSSYPAHGEGRPDPLLTPLPEWLDLGADEPARRRTWRRKLVSPQPVAEVEAIRWSLRGGQPYGDPPWSEAMAQKLGRPFERRPQAARGRPKRELTPGFSNCRVFPHPGARVTPSLCPSEPVFILLDDAQRH